MRMRTLSNTLKRKRRHKVYVNVCDWINIYGYVHSNDFFFDTKRDVTSLIAASRSARYRRSRCAARSTTQQTGHPMMLVMVALSLSVNQLIWFGGVFVWAEASLSRYVVVCRWCRSVYYCVTPVLCFLLLLFAICWKTIMKTDHKYSPHYSKYKPRYI